VTRGAWSNKKADNKQGKKRWGGVVMYRQDKGALSRPKKGREWATSERGGVTLGTQGSIRKSHL